MKDSYNSRLNFITYLIFIQAFTNLLRLMFSILDFFFSKKYGVKILKTQIWLVLVLKNCTLKKEEWPRDALNPLEVRKDDMLPYVKTILHI